MGSASLPTRPYINPQPHSCIHCEDLIIDLPERPSPEYVISFLRIKRYNSLGAAEDDCLFLKSLRELISEDSFTLRLYCRFRALYRQPQRLKRLKGWLKSCAVEVEADLSPYGTCQLRFSPIDMRSPLSTSILFQCFVHANDPAARYIITRPINQKVDSLAARETARQWLHDCHLTHPACKLGSTKFAPTRLLYVGSGHGDSEMYLCNTVEASCTYAALSYVWGIDQPNKTIRGSLSESYKAIDLDTLPKTIQDAIIVTRQLGLRYLWVDSICIVQDDPEDKAKEVSRIRNVFKNAYVTIAASCAANCTNGYLHDRAMAGSPIPPFNLRVRTSDGTFGSVALMHDRRPSIYEDEPIHKRAWTLEERHLSPRLLDYGTRHLRWVCRTIVHSDGGELERPFVDPLFQPMYSIERERPSSFASWTDLVESYTKRSMSKSNDRLTAISGLAQEYADLHGDEYLAGLWRKNLPIYLLWGASKLGKDRVCRPSIYLAPSWSWACLEAHVGWRQSDDTRYTVSTHFELVECHTVPTSAHAPYAALDYGMLRVKARCKKIFRPEEATDRMCFHDSAGQEVRFFTSFDVWQDDQIIPTSMWMLEIGKMNPPWPYEVSGLLLREVDDSTFGRIGKFHIPTVGAGETCFEPCEPQTITII